MRYVYAALTAAALLAPSLADAQNGRNYRGSIGDDGAVVGPVGGLEDSNRSVGAAIGDDGAVIGPVGGPQTRSRTVGGVIGDDGAVIGPVGSPPDLGRGVGGVIGDGGTVLGPVGGRIGAGATPVGAGNGPGPVGALVSPYGASSSPGAPQATFSIPGPVVPGQVVPQDTGSTLVNSGGSATAIVNGHRVLMLPGSNRILQVLD